MRITSNPTSCSRCTASTVSDRSLVVITVRLVTLELYGFRLGRVTRTQDLGAGFVSEAVGSDASTNSQPQAPEGVPSLRAFVAEVRSEHSTIYERSRMSITLI